MTSRIHTSYLGVKLTCSDFIDFCKQMKAHFKHPYDVDWPKEEKDQSVISAKQLVNHMLNWERLTQYWADLNK